MIVRETIYAALWELVHQYKSASATLGGRCSGGAAGVVHERIREPSLNKEAWGTDRMDTLRGILRVRPFKRPLFAAISDFEPAARRSRSRARAVTDDWDPKPWAASNGSARLYNRQASD